MEKVANKRLRKLLIHIDGFDAICNGNLVKPMPIKRKYKKNSCSALLSLCESLERNHTNKNLV